MTPDRLDPAALARLRVISAPLISHLQNRPHHPSWDLFDPDHVDQFLQQLMVRCRARAAERAQKGSADAHRNFD